MEAWFAVKKSDSFRIFLQYDKLKALKKSLIQESSIEYLDIIVGFSW